jgi:hypothetical protein
MTLNPSNEPSVASSSSYWRPKAHGPALYVLRLELQPSHRVMPREINALVKRPLHAEKRRRSFELCRCAAALARVCRRPCLHAMRLWLLIDAWHRS